MPRNVSLQAPDSASSQRTRNLVIAALVAALMASTAWISFPTVAGIPLSPQTFFVVLVAYLLRPKWAGASMALYVLLGAIGLPVFAGGKGGAAVLTGPTGGYLVGFIITAILTSLIFHADTQEAPRTRILIDIIGIVIADLLINILGTLWMMVQMHLSFGDALLGGTIPFLLPNLLKGAAAVLIARYLARAVWASKP